MTAPSLRRRHSTCMAPCTDVRLGVRLDGTMARIPKMIPVSDLRDDVADVLKHVQSSRDPLIITQRGRAAAVMLSVREYERAEYERQLLRALARGEQEIAAGTGHDLDSVFAEADALLNTDEP